MAGTTPGDPLEPIASPTCDDGPRPFVASGNAGAVPRGQTDARRVDTIRWATDEGCTRIEIGVVTATGAPAVDPPGIASAFLRDVGLLRITVGDEVGTSTISTQAVDGLADRVFVVSAPDGGMFIDVHLAEPAFARVDAATAPGRIVVELRAGGPGYGSSPIIGEDLVVVDRPLGAATYPFSVSGYVRSGTGSVDALLEVEGETVRLEAPHGPTETTWGSFVILVPDGPVGDATLTIEERATIELVTG